MSDDFEQEHARVPDQARQTGRETEAPASADDARIAAGAQTGEESLRQSGVIYGGLIAVAVLMVSGFIGASSLDTSFVGLVAAFWNVTWVAGVTFLVAGLVAVGVHSAGFWRVESPRPPGTTA